MIYQQPQIPGEDTANRRSANVTPSYKKGWKGGLGNCRPVSLTWVPGKAIRQIILVPSHGTSRTSRGSDPACVGLGKTTWSSVTR